MIVALLNQRGEVRKATLALSLALTSTITERVFGDVRGNSRLVFDLLHSRAVVHEITTLAAEVERIVS